MIFYQNSLARLEFWRFFGSPDLKNDSINTKLDHNVNWVVPDNFYWREIGIRGHLLWVFMQKRSKMCLAQWIFVPSGGSGDHNFYLSPMKLHLQVAYIYRSIWFLVNTAPKWFFPGEKQEKPNKPWISKSLLHKSLHKFKLNYLPKGCIQDFENWAYYSHIW